jgi:ABC-type amino acid transport substrate-binding protein
MHSKHENRRLAACALMLLIGGLLCSPGQGFPREQTPTDSRLRVGVFDAPPLYMKTAGGRWEGFSIELWEAVGRQLGLSWEFREFGSLEPLLDALETREIDLIPSLPVGESLISRLDFSQSYLKSGLAIAVPAAGEHYRWLRIFESIFSGQILRAIGLLLLMSLAAGIAVWLFERRRNSEMFGGGPIEGLGHGFWWAMVTLTTVGYGDKAPRTTGGRVVALVWMLFSIVFIAAFTANIAASLTVRELSGKVRGINDLYDARVGSIHRSEGFDFLTKRGIAVIPFTNVSEGLAALAGGKIDAFVQNDQVMRHLAKSEFPGQVYVLDGIYDEYFVSIALQANSPLRKPINRALLKFMKTPEWAELLSRYLQ